VRVKLPSGTPAELAGPSSEGSGSLGVALAPDIMGLRPLFDQLCSDLASDHGWLVCAPEPFPGRESLSLDERFAHLPHMSDEIQVRDLVEAADRTGCERRAVLGFCMGGMYAYKAAATASFDRAVSFYGMLRVPEPWRGPNQQDPLDLLSGGTPVLAIVGGHDPYTPPEDVAALRRVPDVTVVEYPEAEHGFVHDPARPAHRAADARDAWRRVADFLA
jgi:carboxymethylenebutenolidase